MRGQRLTRLLWLLVGLVVALLVVKFFFADVYRVTSGSMRPTLFGGPAQEGGKEFDEWVLVEYGRGDVLSRFELVVVSREGEDPVVKRVAGLPGESLQIDDGDLLIDGKRLPVDARRVDPIPVFDDRYQPIQDYFEYRRGPESPWSERDGTWSLDAVDIAPGSDGGMMFFQPDVRDGYLDEQHHRVPGKRSVNDVMIDCDVALDLDDGTLRFQVVEKADTFEVRIRPVADDELGASHVVELVRRGAPLLTRDDPNAKEAVLARAGLDLRLHEWVPLHFANVDNHVILDVGHGFRLTATYDHNDLFPGIAPRGDQSIGPRAAFGAEGTRARFRRVRISRDVYYTSFPPEGYGVAAPVFLADDEVFLLGDNSAASNDSRRFGPVPLSDLAGRPIDVVWPPSRLRRLH